MRLIFCLLLGLMFAAGCEEPQGGSAAAPAPTGGSAPPPPARPGTMTDEPLSSPQVASGETRQETDQDVADNGYDRDVAAVGMGKQGRNYGGGVISEPIRQYFRAGQQIQLIQMQQTMRHFKALNDRNPASHEEFMEEIINKGGVQLPELPPGERYVYDPEQGELMVERPRK